MNLVFKRVGRCLWEVRDSDGHVGFGRSKQEAVNDLMSELEWRYSPLRTDDFKVG